MTLEIERKFLLQEVPRSAFLGEGVDLKQGYLAEDGGVSVRIRITPAASVLTIKAGMGLTRTEVEFNMSSEQVEALWPHTASRRIVKTRHRVSLDGPEKLVAEVDLYGDHLEGLGTVEVEFSSESQAFAFVSPEWFGTEVTGVEGWTNAALAKNGRPNLV